MAFRPSLPPFILESAALRSQSAWTLMAQALLTGLVSGGVIGLFRWLYTIINGAVRAHMAGQDPFAPATLALMAAGLLLMALTAGLLLRYEPLIGGSGIPQVELIAAGKLPPMRWARVLWCKFVATLAALSAGLSVGREGPCIMMGATVGAGVGYMWHDRCRANRPRYLVGGGVAGMTAAFGAPVAGMFFAFEEMKTPLTLPMLLFTSLSALSAWFMVDVVLDFGLVFPFARLPGLHWSQYWLPLLAGMSCGLLGAVYNAGMIRLLLWQDRARWLPGPVRIVFPFVCCGVLLLVWPEITGNMGLTTLQLEHLRLPALALALLLAGKIAFSCVSFASGVSGGILMPILLAGSMAGALLAAPLRDAGLVAPEQTATLLVLGMAGLFSASVRTPLTGAALVMEMCGGFHLAPAVLLAAFAAAFTANALHSTPGRRFPHRGEIMTRLFPCLALLLCCLAACTSRNVPDKAGYTPVAAPWTCATYLDSGENALTPVLMLDGWAAARTQQVRLGTAGTDALLDHLEAWCPAHREEKLADVILAWRRRHADRGRMLPAVSCAGWYAPATRPITGNEQQLALSLWLAGHALGRAGLEVPLQDQQRLDRIFALFDSGESPLHQYCRRDPDALVLHGLTAVGLEEAARPAGAAKADAPKNYK